MVRFSIMDQDITVGLCAKCRKSKHAFHATPWTKPPSFETPLHVVKVVHLPSGKEEWRCHKCIRSLDLDLGRKLYLLDYRSFIEAYQELRKGYLMNSTWNLIVSTEHPSGAGLAALNISYLSAHDKYVVLIPSSQNGERVWVRIRKLVPPYTLEAERIAKPIGKYKCGNCGNEKQERFCAGAHTDYAVSCISCNKSLNRSEKLSKRQVSDILASQERS